MNLWKRASKIHFVLITSRLRIIHDCTLKSVNKEKFHKKQNQYIFKKTLNILLRNIKAVYYSGFLKGDIMFYIFFSLEINTGKLYING